MRAYLTAALIVSCSGCSFTTKLESRKVDNAPGSGLMYRLPAKQFQVKATFELTECVSSGSSARLDAKVTATLTESLIADPAQTYVLDYQALNATTKVTTATIDIAESGFLTGVNATMTDQSGAMIQNTVTAVASVARAAALPTLSLNLSALSIAAQAVSAPGAPPADILALAPQVPLHERNQLLNALAGTPGGPRVIDVLGRLTSGAVNPCDSLTEAKQALDKARTNFEAAVKKGKELTKIKIELVIVDEEIVGLKSDAESYKKFGTQQLYDNAAALLAIKQARKDAITQRINQLGDPGLDAATKELAEARTALIFEEQADFVPTSESPSISIRPAMVKLGELFGDATLAEFQRPEIVVELSLPSGATPQKVVVPESIGIAYRIATPAFVRVKQPSLPAGSEVLLEHLTMVPQLGPIGSIDLSNGLFDDNNITVAFNASGAPSKLEFKVMSAQGANATAAVSGAAQSYLTLQQNKQADQIAAYKSQMELQGSAITLEKNKLGLAESSADSQSKILKSRIEALKEMQRLEAVRTDTASANDVKIDALDSQMQMLTKQIEIEKLEADLKELQAKKVPAE